MINNFDLQACMLCSNVGLNFTNKLRDDDTRVAAECPACGHVQITPLPTIEEDNEYYQKNEMNRRLISKNQMDDVEMMMKYKIWGDEQCSLIDKILHTNDLRILEIGSGYGWFVEKMRAQGNLVDGIELSNDKKMMAKKRAGIELMGYNLLANNLPKKLLEKYDLVCMFHVMEHILNPVFFLSQVLKMLKPGGGLLVVVPNFFCKLKDISAEFNDFFYFRAHLSYFKPETLRLLFDKVELKNVFITGTQLYSLENSIYWIREKKPFLEYSQIGMPHGLEWIGDIYKKKLEDDLVSDGLVAVGYK